MKYEFNSRKELEEFVKVEILTSAEATELMDIKRSRMSKLIASGRITPIKKLDGGSLFFRSDIIEISKEL